MKRSMKGTVPSVLKNLFEHKWMYIRNAAVLQFLLTTVGFWGLSRIFKLMLYVAGQDNITLSNIRSILTNPLSLVLIIVYLLAIAFLMFIEFAMLSLMIYGTLRNVHFSWRSSLKKAVYELKQLFGVQLLGFVLYFILMIPLANIGLASSVTEHLYIPKFITGEITKTAVGQFGYSIGILILFYINIRLLLTLPLTVLTDESVFMNMKRSWKITKQRFFGFITALSALELLLVLLATIFVIIAFLGVTMIDPTGSNVFWTSFFLTVIKIILFFFAVFSKLAIITTIVKMIAEENVVSETLVMHVPEKPFRTKWTAVLAVITIIGMYVYNGVLLYTSQLNTNTLLIAHRGFVEEGVENSIEALEAAAKQGVDYVEMDILLTKDHKFVVMHDYNLKRLAGVDKKVQDMNADEVVGLPIQQGDFTSHIPSFEEYVAKAKELGVKLLVELKPHGAEPSNYTDLFIAKMRELGVDTTYKTMSLNLKVMEEINAKAPEIDTGYVIPIQFGGFGNPAIDFYVIEDFSYNEQIVYETVQKEKQVFVWTINEPDQMEYYLQSPISGIITDIPDVGQQTKKDLREQTGYIDRLFRMLGPTK